MTATLSANGVQPATQPWHVAGPVGKDHGTAVGRRSHLHLRRWPGAVPWPPARHDLGSEAMGRAEHGHGELGVELEVGVAEGVGARLAEGLVGVDHEDVDVSEGLARVGMDDGDPGTDAVRHGGLADGRTSFSSRSPTTSKRGLRQGSANVSSSITPTPSPRLSMKYSRLPAPATSPTGHWPNRDASSSLRVNWLVRKSSTLMELPRLPGE